MAPDALVVRAVGILLAAGAGTRYGKPKVFARDGLWLRNSVAALAEGGCEEVLVVLGAARPVIPSPARAVIASRWSEGLGQSLRAGLAAAEGTSARLAVLSVIDTPDVGNLVVARVLAAADAAPPGTVMRAVYNARPGHPVVLPRATWVAAAASATGDRGARDFLASYPMVSECECGDLATGRDIDYAKR